MLLDSLTATGEALLVDLILDGLVGVGDENRRGSGGAHLGVMTTKSGEELRMDQRGLGPLEARSDITSHAEIWILVNRARDKAVDIVALTEDRRERSSKRRRSLDGREVTLADIIAADEAEGALGLIVSDELLDLAHDGVHGSHVIQLFFTT